MTCRLYILLDKHIIEPEQITEPMMTTMRLDMAIVKASKSAGCSGDDADAWDGGLSPSMVTAALSDGD